MEFMREVAIPLPARIICEILGVDPDRHRELRDWIDTIRDAATGVDDSRSPEEHRAAVTSLSDTLGAAIAKRRAHPGDDLISELIAGGPAGERLTDAETLSFSTLLLMTGMETTTNLLGNTVRALLAYPDAYKQVRTDTSAIPDALEETLRWDAPAQATARQTTEPVTLAGTTIPKGSPTMLLLGSANRDEDQFERADAFEITRRGTPHLAFGSGVHFCLGAALARLEARCALEALFERCSRIEPAYDSVEVVGSLLIRAPKALPLEFSTSGSA